MWESVERVDPGRAADYRTKGWWREATFLSDVARHAAARPDHPAVVAYEDDRLARELTYGELPVLVDRFAGALAALLYEWLYLRPLAPKPVGPAETGVLEPRPGDTAVS